MMRTRTEADSIGVMEVPAEAYYGVQALRAKENFPITHQQLHPEFIKSMNTGFDFIILTCYTFRLKRNFITQESIPVSKKTLLILIA